jgi:hypothetical protein
MKKPNFVLKIFEGFKNPNPMGLLIFQAYITMFTLIQTWVLQYKDLTGNAGLINRISFQVNDPPFLPSGNAPQVILYKHFFGDWENLLDLARSENPYLIPNAASQTPPIGNMILKILSNFGTKYSFALLLIASAVIWLFLFRKVFKEQVFFFASLSIILYVGLTLPVIYSFDRGSLHILAFGLVGIAWYLFTIKKNIGAVTFFIVAVSFKPQLLLALLLLLISRDFLKIIKSIFLVITSNILCLLYFEGNPLLSIQGYVKGTLFFTSKDSLGYTLDSASLSGFLLRRYEGESSAGNLSSWLIDQRFGLLLPGLVLILIFLPIILSNIISQRVKIFLVLSLTSLVVPASMAYTMVWASLAIIPFLTQRFNFRSLAGVGSIQEERNQTVNSNNINPAVEKVWHFSDFLSLLVITLVLTPSFIVHWTGVRNISFSRDYYPVLVLLVCMVSYLEMLNTTRKKKSQSINLFH